MRKTLSVAVLNFKEAIRDKFFWGVIFFFIFYLLFCIFLSKLSIGHSDKVLRAAGITGIELSSVTLIIFAFTLSFYRDKNSRMLPIYLSCFRRRDYLCGKILGFAALSFVYLLLSGLCYVFILYLFGTFTPVVLAAFYPIFLKTVIIVCFTSFFCCLFSSSLLALLSGLFIYLSSMLAFSAFSVVNVYGSSSQKSIFRFIYMILPNMDKLDISYLTAWGKLPPSGYFPAITLYSGVYALLLLLVNLSIFESKEY